MQWKTNNEKEEKKIFKERVNFTIDEDLNNSFSNLCEKELRKKSSVVQHLIQNYVNQRT